MPLRYLRLGPWRGAPRRALSIMSLSSGVAIAAFVLALAAGSRPMFASSAASGSLSADIDDGCRFAVGLTVDRVVAYAPVPAGGTARFPPADAAEARAALATALRGVEHLERVTTVYGPLAQVAAATAPDDTTGPVILVSRSGFEQHIEVLDRVDAPGVWVPSNVASTLGLRAGDTIVADFDFQVPGAPPTGAALPVAGVFHDLSERRDEFWCSSGALLQEQRTGGAPPPVLLMEEGLLLDTFLQHGGTTAYTRWEVAPPATGWTLADATSAQRVLHGVVAAANNPTTPLGEALGRGAGVTDAASSLQHARRTKATVSSAAGPIALATAGVAMIVLLSAARSWLDRRRREVTVLALRGAGPVALAAKAVLELAAPLALGAGAGLAMSVVLVRRVGPSTLIEASAMRAGAVQVALALVVAAVACACVVAAAVRRVTDQVDGARPRDRLVWWEPPVLLLAAGALYEVRHSSPAGTTADVDSLALLAPFLLLAGGSGLLARLVLGRRALQRVGARLPTAGWLAVRRLGARRLRAVAVMTTGAVAVGVVVFAGSMSASIRATATAKSILGAGAEQVVRIGIRDELPADFTGDGRSTVVTRQSESGVLVRGHASADVLGVDPHTFADAAYWDDSFAGASLDSLLARLDADAAGAIPVVAVGDGLPDTFVLTVPADGGGDVEIEVAVAGRADAFPGLGLRRDRPLVVIDRTVLGAAGVTRPVEVWATAAAGNLGDRVAEAGMTVVTELVHADATRDSTVQAQLWTVAYLEVIGLAAALASVAALGLYFAASLARHRLGSAVARRMGMTRRTAAAATAIEVGALLGAAWVFGGALSWVAARLVHGSFDPRPNSPPAALFRFGTGAAALAGVGAIALAAVVAIALERDASRRSLQEVLRDAD